MFKNFSNFLKCLRIFKNAEECLKMFSKTFPREIEYNVNERPHLVLVRKASYLN